MYISAEQGIKACAVHSDLCKS